MSGVPGPERLNAGACSTTTRTGQAHNAALLTADGEIMYREVAGVDGSGRLPRIWSTSTCRYEQRLSADRTCRPTRTRRYSFFAARGAIARLLLPERARQSAGRIKAQREHR